jgi:hypothetical protein
MFDQGGSKAGIHWRRIVDRIEEAGGIALVEAKDPLFFDDSLGFPQRSLGDELIRRRCRHFCCLLDHLLRISRDAGSDAPPLGGTR